jgi:hypothetical protein
MKGSSFGSGRELKNLPSHLHDGEEVRLLASGSYAGGIGLLALTDRRLLFVRDGIMSKANEDFAFDRINSIQSKSGMLTGSVVITVGGTRSEITNVEKNDGKAIADAVREIISAPAAAPAPAPAGDDVYAQLKKLAELRDAGILTDAEFDAKKAELVSRI